MNMVGYVVPVRIGRLQSTVNIRTARRMILSPHASVSKCPWRMGSCIGYQMQDTDCLI